MVLAFGAQGHWFEFCQDLIFMPCIYSFVSFFLTDFVCKMGACLGLAKEPLIPFNVQKMDFLRSRLSVINK